MSQVSKETATIDSTVSDTDKKKIAAAASFKKLQPEEFYRHHIEKVCILINIRDAPDLSEVYIGKDN